ncbi:MAG: hypothetical protein DRJ02_02240 [Bacteroidetes bacterium]|nr:MAG: hypothetical protein DRJ02_02240 [Bacteroidota bacterium]
MDIITNSTPGENRTQSIRLYYGILLFWLLLNLVQAFFTELIHDEAYYYFYSTDLAWGYYDHPPMLALLIKLGSFILPGELGVRLLIVLFSVAALVLFMKLAEVKNYLLFFTVWFSILIVQVGGFIAVPDVPLIFFSAVFFVAYRNYLRNESLKNVLLVSLSIAALLYSKYTGILVVFFTVLSNLKLVKQKSFWLIFITSSVLMVPHLIWEIQHDFVTVHYHLGERSIGYYFKWQNITNYLLGQIGIMNPLIAFILLYFGVIYKPENLLDKALKYNAFGVLMVGLIMSFRGPVEANWTSTAIIPLMIIAYKGFSSRKRFVKSMYILGIISAVLVFGLRFILVGNYLPEKYKHSFKAEFHDWDVWAETIHEIAGDTPVVFINSYQKASKYYFYGNKNTFTYNSVKYRLNQFDIEGIEKELFGKEVMLFNNDKHIWVMDGLIFPIPVTDSIETAANGKMYYCTIPEYRTYNFLRIDFELPENEFAPGSVIEIPIDLINPFDKPFTIGSDSLGTFISVTYYLRGEVVSYQELEDITGLTINNKYHTILKTQVPEEQGKYFIRIVIRAGWLPPGHNSRARKIFVE